MIPFASIEGKLIFLIVVAVIGFINWVMEKAKKPADGESSKPSPAPRRPSDDGNSDEQERLRRFLEALGVPPPGAQPRQQPQPRQLSQQPPVKISRPMQRSVAQKSRPVAQLPKPQIRPIILQRPPLVRETHEMRPAGRLENAASSIENISGEFGAMNVRVTMQPLQTPDRPEHMGTGNAGTTSVMERSGSPIAARLRELLHNPTDLRAAFVAMEVVGTPRGLQAGSGPVGTYLP